METITLSIQELTDLVKAILVAHNTSEANAAEVASALVAAEIDGQRGHGLSRVASYSAQARSGKVNGQTDPSVDKTAPSLLRVDANHGFAFPAFSQAIEELISTAKETGVAMAAITHSHHCGVMGHHVEKLANAGLIGLVFSNSPKAIAPWGGKDAIFGTNPIAFAVPRISQPPLVIDLSLSKVARGKIKVAAEEGKPIPVGWALDPDGQATTNAKAAVSGTMLPMGDAKGATLVLMVEILSAALTASHFGFEASSFFDAEGPSPDIGQLIVAISPGPLSGGQFAERLETLFSAILEQPGTRLPGSGKAAMRKKAEQDGIEISRTVHERLLKLN
jgi:(2R)-3-sulfolactate dehydrogenase (NADP+)